MTENALIGLNLDGFLAFFAVLAVVIAVMYWLLQRRERTGRTQFLSRFHAKDLQMSPYRIGIVYKVVAEAEDSVTVVPVWDGRSEVAGATEISLSPGVLIPFDEARFV